jgi:hypothetical protein
MIKGELTNRLSLHPYTSRQVGLTRPAIQKTIDEITQGCIGLCRPMARGNSESTILGRANEISGLLVTAIVGGAILPPMVVVVADHSSIRTSFFVPIVDTAYVFLLYLIQLRVEGPPVPDAQPERFA